MKVERIFASSDHTVEDMLQSYFIEKIDTIVSQDYDLGKVNTATSPKEEIQ
ncbi:hypothetical protein M662_03255 [Bacillus sp. SB49]|uniref:hypothetical protein n=1 Tax=Bacillus sp. SB49 TaxID=1071080 RepID=UPI00040F68C8|nr:hypothetical protein [Bacillus sp. SB49]QHT45570.1 hypothetical protein M662_03255 [Bacillus sp. SB49]